MISIDGSHNEGGGQILRTALSLSLCTRTRFGLRIFARGVSSRVCSASIRQR